jgi:hypothetical protein
MNIDKLQQVLEQFRETAGGGLIACDVWGPDGLSIVGYNPHPEAVALFADITSRLRQALSTSGFPTLGRYYLLELENHKMVCVMLFENHQCGCLIDLRYIVMGKLIQRALPQALEGLRAALAQQ